MCDQFCKKKLEKINNKTILTKNTIFDGEHYPLTKFL